MFKNGRNTDGPVAEAKTSENVDKGSWFKDNQRSIIAVGLIVIMAFVMRFIFSYGISADSAFALSGGSIASEHLHTITDILDGGSFFGSDGSFNYPFGSVNSNPVFIDMVLAGIAMIGTSLGMASVKAASFTLATFSLACGTLAVIPAFLLGKEVIGTRKAGYVAALFIALCPVVITQTVFSNGTETGWILLVFTVFALFMFKGIKAINETKMEDGFKAVLSANASAIKLAAIAGLLLALIVLSTNEFRPIVTLLIVAMPVMAAIGRFQYKDTRMTTVFFSIVTAIGMAVACAYYIPALLWDDVLSGILIVSVISIVLCVSFSMLQTKPWVVTVPAYLIGVIVVFALLAAFVPDLFNVIVNGNSIYADSLVELTKSSLSLSKMSTNYGVVPFWLAVFVIGVMVFRLPKNLSSITYQFTLLFMIVAVCFVIRDDELATVFSPAIAVGFAYAVMWMFDHVDFKTYFLSIKNAGFKGAFRKIIKPIPFVSILAVALLICVPCAMYAIDASISSNDNDKYGGMDLGAMGYYVKTDEDWTVGPVLSSYASVQKTGALVTWIDYADDAATRGNFDVIADSNGHGSEAASNILLANAVDGSSSAAMLIRLLTYSKFTDSVKSALVTAGLSETDYAELQKIVEKPADYKSTVVGNVDRYGAVSTDISSENVMYIYGTKFLTQKDDGSVKYDAYTISSMYSAVAGVCGKNISYFMVNGGMFPMYYGYSSSFSTMAYANGYVMSDSYGTIPQFTSVDYYTMYMTGIYAYTDAMYDTLLWRSYIGMSPAEAGFTGQAAAASYFSALMASNGTYKAEPGYGLSNYVVDESTWYVKYNADSNATATSDGWVKMLCSEAEEKQKTDGGLINYLSGYPIFMKYVSNNVGNPVSGTVASAGVGVKNIRVSVVDSDGIVRSTAFTNDEGKYKVLVTDNNSKIKFYAGSQNFTDGSLIKTVDYSGATQDVTIDATTIEGAFYVADAIKDMSGATFELVGKVSGAKYSNVGSSPALSVSATGFTGIVIPDIYDITLKSADGKVSYVTDKTLTANVGENKGIKVALDVSTVKVTVKDDAGALISASVPGGVEVRLTDVTNFAKYYDVTTDNDSVAVFTVVNGTYAYSFTGNYVTTSAPITVSGDSDNTITAYAATPYTFTGFPADKSVFIYSTGYQMTGVSDSTGEVKVKLPNGTGAGAVFTAYTTVADGKGYMATTASPAAAECAVKVSGTLKDSSDKATTGTILFNKDGYQIPVSAASDGTYEVYLATGDYTVYANNGNQVRIEKLTVGTDAIADKVITMAEGTSVSGKTTWYTSTYSMPFVPIAVSEITDTEGTFNIVTGSDGSYSFYIPKDATCKLVASYVDDGAYYFGESSDKKYTSEKAGVNGNNEFRANVKDITVQNDSSYDIKVKGKSISKTASETIVLSSQSWSLVVEYTDGGEYYYYSGTMPCTPTTGTVTVTDSMLEISKYYVETISGIAAEDVVTVTALGDEGKRDKTTTGTTREYYLQENGEFLITIKNSESTKIYYEQVTATASGTIASPVLDDSVKVTGYVGLNKAGKITATYDAKDIKFDIASSGRYDITLPTGKAITLTAEITDDSDKKITYDYADTIDLPALEVKEGGYVYNLAVTGSGTPVAGDVTYTMAIESMSSSTGLVTIDFTVSFTDTAAATDFMTYVLSGGSDWTDVAFYSDSARTTQISTTTFDASSGTIYGRGTIVASNVYAGSENLSVVLTDSNGEEVCTACFSEDDAKWEKTTPAKGTTKVNIGINSIGDSEYKYAVELVNNDNYTKTFTLVPSFPDGYDASKWFISFVNDKVITEDGTAKIKGYTTATVYVKITAKDNNPGQLPGSVVISATAAGITEMDTDSTESVTVEGATAKATSDTSESAVSVDSNSASGRNAINDKSDLPTYLWLMIAAIIALVFLLIWLAVRRGVFTRRK